MYRKIWLFLSFWPNDAAAVAAGPGADVQDDDDDDDDDENMNQVLQDVESIFGEQILIINH